MLDLDMLDSDMLDSIICKGFKQERDASPNLTLYSVRKDLSYSKRM